MNTIDSLSDAGLEIDNADVDAIDGGIFLIAPGAPWVVVRNALLHLLGTGFTR